MGAEAQSECVGLGLQGPEEANNPAEKGFLRLIQTLLTAFSLQELPSARQGRSIRYSLIGADWQKSSS
jgi:hypothetical protein